MPSPTITAKQLKGRDPSALKRCQTVEVEMARSDANELPQFKTWRTPALRPWLGRVMATKKVLFLRQ